MNEVQKLRKNLGLTQDEFAIRLGVAPFTVRRWETGKSNPSRMAQKLLAEVKADIEIEPANHNKLKGE